MADLKKDIIGITIGIRFGRSFRMSDISGEIIDNILYSEETPFGTDFFPQVQENSKREKTLFNPSTSEYLRINTDDLILGIEINNNFEEKFNWLKDDVIKYLKDILFHKYNIKNIQRLGIIFSHKIAKNKKLSEAINILTASNVSDPDNISISFSKKASTEEALIRKGVSDYKNRIYNFYDLKESLRVDLDYQYYYEPAIEDLRECFTEKILENSKKFLESDFHNWLNAYKNEETE